MKTASTFAPYVLILCLSLIAYLGVWNQHDKSSVKEAQNPSIRDSYIQINRMIAGAFFDCGIPMDDPPIVNVGDTPGDGTGDLIPVANQKIAHAIVLIEQECQIRKNVAARGKNK